VPIYIKHKREAFPWDFFNTAMDPILYTREQSSLFSFNVKYGLPRLPSPPSHIESQQSVCQKRKLVLLMARLSRAKAIDLQSSVMGKFAWARGLYVNAHARTEGM
jgi:hypothetical protein